MQTYECRDVWLEATIEQFVLNSYSLKLESLFNKVPVKSESRGIKWS